MLFLSFLSSLRYKFIIKEAHKCLVLHLRSPLAEFLYDSCIVHVEFDKFMLLDSFKIHAKQSVEYLLMTSVLPPTVRYPEVFSSCF